MGRSKGGNQRNAVRRKKERHSPCAMKKLFGKIFLGCRPHLFWAGNIQDASGTITLGGTSQQLLPAVTIPRTFFFFQNISAGTLWLGFGAAAVQAQPSIQVPTNAIFRMDQVCPDDVINVVGA